MGKLTPTFADKHKGRNKRNGAPPPLEEPLRVVEAHEPLKEAPQWSFPNAFTMMPPQVPFTSGLAVPLAPPIAPAVEPPLKVALVGTAPSSRLLAPFADPSWKIWACSPGNMGTLPRYDAWFEVHSNLLWPQHASYGKPYTEWLKTHTTPVYVLDPTVVPNHTLIPWRELVEQFGAAFFTSSFAWMMALAIKQGVAEIALYGIDMASREEYILQRPGFFFFRREAEKLGIKVTAPNESDILQPPGLYGISDTTPFARKTLAREAELKERVAAATQQRDQAIAQLTYLQGAAEDVDYFKTIWAGVQLPGG